MRIGRGKGAGSGAVMKSSLFNRMVRGKEFPTMQRGAGIPEACADRQMERESDPAPTAGWTVRNRIGRLVKSGRQLIAGAGRRSRRSSACPQRRQVIFSLHAPQADSVAVAGDFNDWRPDVCPLKKSAEGRWERRLELPPGRYEYKFVVDGMWHNDPCCTICSPNPFGGENSVLIVS